MSVTVKEITQRPLPPLVEQLMNDILEKNPLHKKIVTVSLEKMTQEEVINLETYIKFNMGKGLTVDYLSESYLMFVFDTMKEQLYFQKHKKYRFSTLDEVAGSVYYDPDYMSKYVYGIAVSCFIWPHHLGMLRYFNETVPKGKKGTYLEVGPGHGLFFMSALATTAFDHFVGLDISETSLGQTKEIVDFFLPDKGQKYSLQLKDFLDADQLQSNSYDAVVTGEVIEHVEEPELFLRRIADIAKPDAYIYLTTCCNAAVIDHIYLFRTPKEVEDMMDECGLKVVKPFYLPYEGKSVEECLERDLPMSLAYVLQKKV
ncbi:MAG: class I SAM-dependent methyltransferase [Alphaproteobacteria bacterium]|nr:class I SAM-dependent methyltransferase [Alphaproteobacteria bacterium]